MALKLLKNGKEISAESESELKLLDFCQRQNLDCVMEWIDGQYWLHSDREKENPFTVRIDEELRRHEDYFKRNSLQKELLARAIGVKGGFRPKVLDLTAGLLGDSLLFLSFGTEQCVLQVLLRVHFSAALQESENSFPTQLSDPGSFFQAMIF